MTSTDLDTQLARQLSAAAERIDVPPGNLGRVTTRGRRRSRAARAGVVAVATLFVAGTVAVRLGGDPSVETGTADGFTLGDTGVVWSRSTPTTALGMLSSEVAAGGGRVYALSTAAGQRSTDAARPNTVWTSTDGVDWSVLARPADLYVGDLAPRGSRIYAVGTGPATVQGGRSTPTVQVGWSDGGAWDRAVLDIDLASVNAASSGARIGSPQVAATDGGVVAVVEVSATPNVARLLPAGTALPNGWSYDADGIHVLGARDPGEVCDADTKVIDDRGDRLANGTPAYGVTCVNEGERSVKRLLSAAEAYGVLRTFTWAELGVQGDALAAFTGQPLLFRADADGTSFSRVALPSLEANGMATLVADGSGFQLLLAGVGTDTGMRSLRSDDGRTWSAGGDLPAGMHWITAAGRVGDRTVVVGDGGDSPVVAVAGPSGWETVGSLRDVVEGADGKQVFASAAAVGSFGIVVAVGVPTGDERDVDWQVLVSRDARTWSSIDPSEVAGEEVTSIYRVLVAGDRAVVSVVPAQERVEGQGVRQVALVAS